MNEIDIIFFFPLYNVGQIHHRLLFAKIIVKFSRVTLFV